MKEYLIEKYEGYIKNLERRLSIENHLHACIYDEIQNKIEAYREILTDLKML